MDSFGSRKEVKEEPPIESVAQMPQECFPCVQAPKPLLELGALTCGEPHPPHIQPHSCIPPFWQGSRPRAAPGSDFSVGLL